MGRCLYSHGIRALHAGGVDRPNPVVAGLGIGQRTGFFAVHESRRGAAGHRGQQREGPIRLVTPVKIVADNVLFLGRLPRQRDVAYLLGARLEIGYSRRWRARGDLDRAARRTGHAHPVYG